jgi:hypothetical protein
VSPRTALDILEFRWAPEQLWIYWSLGGPQNSSGYVGVEVSPRTALDILEFRWAPEQLWIYWSLGGPQNSSGYIGV